jgi:tRNA-modifying protein YgfZ
MILSLDEPLLLELSGADAGKVLHNLTTNHVLNLPVGGGLETFITNVRGWVVAHGIAFRIEEECWWLVGQHPHPENVAEHIDRYIIREDARLSDRSDGVVIEVITEISSLDTPAGGQHPGGGQILRLPPTALGDSVAFRVFQSGDAALQSGDEALQSGDSEAGNADPFNERAKTSPDPDWERLRISRFWPRMSSDIWEKCIPQELDRNEQAISFVKGCYLGQETIARLDALGQIQKKLCLVHFAAPSISPLAPISSIGNLIGHVTSSSNDGDSSFCLAVLKRGYFEPGTLLECDGISGTVLTPTIP